MFDYRVLQRKFIQSSHVVRPADPKAPPMPEPSFVDLAELRRKEQKELRKAEACVFFFILVESAMFMRFWLFLFFCFSLLIYQGFARDWRKCVWTCPEYLQLLRQYVSAQLVFLFYPLLFPFCLLASQFLYAGLFGQQIRVTCLSLNMPSIGTLHATGLKTASALAGWG